MPFLIDTGEPSDEAQIWQCDPLLVAHPGKGVVYVKRTDAEFVPSPDGFGTIKALTPAADGWQPVLQITDWHDVQKTMIMPLPTRGGRILFGHDDQGNPYTWHINYAADLYLTTDAAAPEPYQEPTE